MKLIMTLGLPASGKSTWAKEQAAKSGGQVRRINKDDLRDMLDGGKWSKNNEKNILQVRDLLIEHHLSAGTSVIVDDTNLHPKHKETLKVIAAKYDAKFETKSFLDVPLLECIARDLKRPSSVGERVIRGMFDEFLAPKEKPVAPPVWDSSLPTAIICDIDGTLAHGIGVTRKPYEWDKVDTDTKDRRIAHILEVYRHVYDNSKDIGADLRILLVSGRDGSCREKTEKWLADNEIKYDALFMRPAGDTRNDAIIKEEIYQAEIAGKYNVEFVLDDRDRVVAKWRELGLTCFQVANGAF